MRILPLALTCLALSAQAGEPALRPSARLLQQQPEMLQAGRCIRYEEGGAGWVATDPVFFISGEVLSSEVRIRHLGRCPLVPGKTLLQYSREEFNRYVLAAPCVSAAAPERDEQAGMVRIRVTGWETPHAKKAENAGRLYRGMFIGQKLEKGSEIELEADLLSVCGT